ncbi:MAG: TraB/GumN family protein [Spirochaetales bacterium]|nr:TraB/GumN family protein [Spirochaetales bacterium]
MKLSVENITLIGTNHVSDESGKEIKEFLAENPVDIVCVELDVERYSRIDKGDTGFSVDQVLAQIESIGLPGFLLSTFIAFFQRILAVIFNIKPGYDMITAIECAKKENKKLFFIDQDAEVTLKKFSQTLTIEEILTILPRMIMYGLQAMSDKDSDLFTMLDISKVPPLKLIRLVNKQAKMVFPSFYKVIIKDRNSFMAKRIIEIVNKHPGEKLLVVIGGGHIEGITNLLKKHFSPDEKPAGEKPE